MQRYRPTARWHAGTRRAINFLDQLDAEVDDDAERHPVRAHRALTAPGACGRDVDLSA
jgi:hypothetical protein